MFFPLLQIWTLMFDEPLWFSNADIGLMGFWDPLTTEPDIVDPTAYDALYIMSYDLT